jgi:hypothetical protein
VVHHGAVIQRCIGWKGRSQDCPIHSGYDYERVAGRMASDPTGWVSGSLAHHGWRHDVNIVLAVTLWHM